MEQEAEDNPENLRLERSAEGARQTQSTQRCRISQAKRTDHSIEAIFFMSVCAVRISSLTAFLSLRKELLCFRSYKPSMDTCQITS